MELQGKVTVVTGAAGGIGKALAERFHAEGANVVLADREAAALEATVAKLNATRPNSAFAVAANLGTEQANAELVRASIEKFGQIDLFFANAGVGLGSDLSTSEQDWDTAFDINFNAHRWAAKHLLPDWLARGEGYFCSTASAAGLLSNWFCPVHRDETRGCCVCRMDVDYLRRPWNFGELPVPTRRKHQHVERRRQQQRRPFGQRSACCWWRVGA